MRPRKKNGGESGQKTKTKSIKVDKKSKSRRSKATKTRKKNWQVKVGKKVQL